LETGFTGGEGWSYIAVRGYRCDAQAFNPAGISSAVV